MAKYKKKPIIIEAIQYTGKNLPEIYNMNDFSSGSFIYNYQTIEGLQIHTLEGDVTVSIGDYIIKGIKGEIYPCKPDIFEMTYDLVEGE